MADSAIGGIELHFLRGENGLDCGIKLIGDIAQVVGVVFDVVGGLGEVIRIALGWAGRRIVDGVSKLHRILERFQCGTVRNIVDRQFCGLFGFGLRLLEAVLMHGQRLRVQLAGVAGGLRQFSLIADDDGHGDG